MKTRTLMLLALGCGLAIMLAGAVFLFQLTRQEPPDAPTPIGATVLVGDMSVTVDGATETDGVLRVSVTIEGTDDLDPADDFRLIASARPADRTGSTCPAVAGAAVSCEVEFAIDAADGVSRVLFYERGEDAARWVLG